MPDDHWNGPYENKCQACLLNYDYIVKLETNHIDASYIIHNKLSGRESEHSELNRKRGKAGNAFRAEGRDLSRHFRNLTHAQFVKLYRKYEADFGMYGYSFDEERSLAKCGGEGEDGTMCC